MPRKPARSRWHRGSRHWPLIFSPVFRTMFMATSRKEARQETKESKLENIDHTTSSGNGFMDHGREHAGKSDSSDSEGFEGVVQTDFAFFDPKPSDFHGVKVLLQTFLDNKEWDLSSFVELILAQPTVGTVVKINDDEDDAVYSVISCLNLGRYKDNKCIVELKDYLLKTCHDTNVLAKFKPLVGEHAKYVGLMVSQRVVNLPPQLLPPLYDALFDEVEWATEDEPTEALRSSFRFKFYLIISKIYKHKNAEGKGPGKSVEEPVIYTKPEDEIFVELSSWSFSFPLLVQPVRTNELKNYRLMGLVMAVEASKISMFRKQIHSLIDD